MCSGGENQCREMGYHGAQRGDSAPHMSTQRGDSAPHWSTLEEEADS